MKWSPSEFWEATTHDVADAMAGHAEARHNDFAYHAAIHGVKVKPYVDMDVLMEKANRLDEITKEEAKQGKSLSKILESIKNKTYHNKNNKNKK